MSELNADHMAILQIWSDYKEGIYDGDADRLAAIFHPAASMFFVRNDGVVVTPIGDYINVVRNRPAPRAVGAARKERLIGLAVPSDDTAVLTVSILIMGKHFTDQLTLIKAAGAWKIISKTYHLDYEVAA